MSVTQLILLYEGGMSGENASYADTDTIEAIYSVLQL